MPEICWEEILFVFCFDVWSGSRTLAFHVISQDTAYGEFHKEFKIPQLVHNKHWFTTSLRRLRWIQNLYIIKIEKWETRSIILTEELWWPIMYIFFFFFVLRRRWESSKDTFVPTKECTIHHRWCLCTKPTPYTLQPLSPRGTAVRYYFAAGWLAEKLYYIN